MIIAKKNAAYYLSFPAIDSATPSQYKTGVSPVDTAYYKDGAGAWTSLAITDTASEIGTTGIYEIDLTSSEMNHDKVVIKFAVSGMADDGYQFDLRAKLTDDLQDLTAAQVNTECDTALTDYDPPTNAEMEARTLVAASYFDPAADTVANVSLVATTTTNTDMRGTDSAATAAALAVVDTNVDSILVDTATTIPALIAALNDPTAAAVAAAVYSYNMGNGRTIGEALSFLRNKWLIAGGTLTVYDTDDTTVLWTAPVSTAAGDPVSGIDPV